MTERDAKGKGREMTTVERGLRIAGGVLEAAGGVSGAGEEAATLGKAGRQSEEVVEAVTNEGVIVRTKVPKQTAVEAAGAKPVQTAEESQLYSKSAASKTNNAVGGAYKDVATVKNGVAGEVHHTPANKINQMKMDDGPAIWMTKQDHQTTSSWGSGLRAKAYRAKQEALIQQGRFREAVQMDINDIHALFGSKYDKNINEMLKYVDELDKAGKLPKATTPQN